MLSSSRGAAPVSLTSTRAGTSRAPTSGSPSGLSYPSQQTLRTAPAAVNAVRLGRGAARRYAGAMQVDVSAIPGSGIPSTIAITGSSELFGYTDTITGGSRTGRIVWTDWYAAAAHNGSVALCGCEGVTGGPPPPPP